MGQQIEQRHLQARATVLFCKRKATGPGQDGEGVWQRNALPSFCAVFVSANLYAVVCGGCQYGWETLKKLLRRSLSESPTVYQNIKRNNHCFLYGKSTHRPVSFQPETSIYWLKPAEIMLKTRCFTEV